MGALNPRWPVFLRTSVAYLRWRILLRILRFFRPILRRPLPVFFTPITARLLRPYRPCAAENQKSEESRSITSELLAIKSVGRELGG